MSHTVKIEPKSLRNLPERESVQAIIRAALNAVDPYEAVKRSFRLDQNRFEISGQSLDLRDYRRIFLVGGGKAALPMAQAVEDILGSRLNGGVMVTKDVPTYEAPESGLTKTRLLTAAHPIPDHRSITAAQEILDLLKHAAEEDLVLCLISGGGSALITAPFNEIRLEDLQELTDRLLRSGATINEINAIRKHVDRIKGGGLARQAAPAAIVTLILSDVIGDPLDVIASGPTVPDETTFQECLEILDKYHLLGCTPEAIQSHLTRGSKGEIPETLKPGELTQQRRLTKIIANNYSACRAAQREAHKLGFNTLFLGSFFQGEARYAGQIFAALARQIQKTGEPIPRPACVIAGGETTVTVRGQGMGGRNQELALGSVAELAGLNRMLLVTLATDGGDGPTDAAGAVVDGRTYQQALEIGMVPDEYLANNDAYTFFESLEDLIRTGPTQTNVNDLTFLFSFEHPA